MIPVLHAQEPNFDVLPVPLSLEKGQGFFQVSELTMFRMPGQVPSFFKSYVQTSKGYAFKSPRKGEVKSDLRNMVTAILEKENGMPDEGYSLVITPEKVVFRAATVSGLFYAEQTLIWLFELNGGRLPSCTITDHPRFGWRGLHLDESRHFLGKAFVKKCLDQLAFLKMNTFHWHLTDAPGWRLEIKKYPKLTEIAAWRPDRTGILFTDADTAKIGEPHAYGGFYTQADLREIVAYAQTRHITIIPEIEMPGHCTAALVAYPEYSCSGGPFPMPGGAKNCPYPNFCVGNPGAFAFLENILAEVMEIFPGPYIHIGGDEVERDQWMRCPKCRAKMVELGMTDPAQLQVWFTKQMETYIRSKGRRLMGWDEIMEGGNLTPSSGVMVWRGENLARQATAAGHEVVITHNYYFDHYQGNPKFEPPAAGYRPIRTVYEYEPVPSDFTSSQKTLIRGVQGCLWTENVSDTAHAEYMLFPRTLALAEVAWSAPEQRQWADFSRRLTHYFEILKGRRVCYATSVFDPEITIFFDSTAGNLEFRIAQQVTQGTIRYAIDTALTAENGEVYNGPFALLRSGTVRTQAFEKDTPISKQLDVWYRPSLASGKPFVLRHSAQPQYNGNRPESLTDGLTGREIFHEGNWCGFYGDDFELTIDLGADMRIGAIELNWLEDNHSWIYLPETAEIAVSNDGVQFRRVAEISSRQLAALGKGRIKRLETRLKGKNGRYVRVYGKNPGRHPVFPEGKCWLFVDEVSVWPLDGR